MSDERERPAPSDRFSPDTLHFDLPTELAALRAERTPPRHGHRQKTLYKRDGLTIALFILDAGAGLPEHVVGGVVTVQPVEGELVLTIAGEPHRVAPGGVLVLSPGVPHDVRAISDAAFLLQVALGDSPPAS